MTFTVFCLGGRLKTAQITSICNGGSFTTLRAYGSLSNI